MVLPVYLNRYRRIRPAYHYHHGYLSSVGSRERALRRPPRRAGLGGEGGRKGRAARSLYELEPQLEDKPAPPNDPGGSGLMVCKAAVQRGLISSYTHAFGVQHALEALVLRPVITGIGWYSSFDKPDPSTGLVQIAPGATIRGGHEIVAEQIDADNQLVWFWHSGGSRGVAPRAGRALTDCRGWGIHWSGGIPWGGAPGAIQPERRPRGGTAGGVTGPCMRPRARGAWRARRPSGRRTAGTACAAVPHTCSWCRTRSRAATRWPA